MSKPINRNVASWLVQEEIDKSEEAAKRKRRARAKAKAGRIQADKRKK